MFEYSEISMNRKGHFEERLKERYDIVLDENEYINFIKGIDPNKFHFKLSCRLICCIVKIKDLTIPILYDRKHNVPITVMFDSFVLKIKNKKYMWKDGQFVKYKGT